MNSEKNALQPTLKTVLDTAIADWRIGCGEDCPHEDRNPYRLKVEFDSTTGQLYFQVLSVDGDSKAPSLDGILEVNRGCPSLHLAPAVDEDNAVHIATTREGLLIVPDSQPPESAPRSRHTYDEDGGLLWRRFQEP